MALSILDIKIPTLGEGYVVKIGYISPSVEDTAHVVFNLKSGQDTPMHISARYEKESYVVFNTHISGQGWDSEERPDGFPFAKGVETSLVVVILKDLFQVTVELPEVPESTFKYDFKHRFSDSMEKLDGIELYFDYAAENYAQLKDFYVLKMW